MRKQTVTQLVILALTLGVVALPTAHADGTNTSSNTNIGLTSGQYDQHQGQGQSQGQTNDSHNVAISQPIQGQNQNNQAYGGNGGALISDSHAKSFTTFGPPATAIRGGDCAGDADGISLFSIFGGIGYSHSDESKTCRTNQVIELTCQNAQEFVKTGAIVAASPTGLTVYGQKILNSAMDMLNMCMQGIMANPINLELRAAYGHNIAAPVNTAAASTGENAASRASTPSNSYVGRGRARQYERDENDSCPDGCSQ